MANTKWLSEWKEKRTSNSHSVFDLSKRMAFHLPNSLIVPIRFIETVPDDHFNININGLLRTETMNKAAFYNGKAVFSAFFVPYKQLWHNFNQFVVMKEDKHSSSYKASAYAPQINVKELLAFVVECYHADVKDQFGYSFAENAARLLQFAKIFNLFPVFAYIDKRIADGDTWSVIISDLSSFYFDKFSDKFENLWRLLAYQHIYYDFYRNKYYDDVPFYQPSAVGQTGVQYVDTYNLDFLTCATEQTSAIQIENFDYDSEDNSFESFANCHLANLLSLHYCQYRHDLYTSLLPSTQFGAISGLQLNGSADLSGISGSISPLETAENIGTSYDTGRWSKVDGSSLPDLVTVQSWHSNNLLINDGNPTRPPIHHDHSINPLDIANQLGVSLNGSTVPVPSRFDVLELRRAELLQQWKQNALRAGNMVDDNFLAHYGVKPYYEDDNNVRFLGQFECRLDVNPVTATADTDSVENGRVGDLAAYGVGSVAGKNLDVQIKDFGVIVICAHFQSEVYYSANGIDKQNTLLEPLDYFQSEFENAGMDTVSAWQQSTGIVGADGSKLDMSFGYTPPYTMYKTEVDEVFGEYGEMIFERDADDPFIWNGSLSAWTAKRSDWLLRRGDDYSFFDNLPLSRFYQSPAVTDDIFGIVYDGKGATDPFGFAVNIECKAIRPMSVLGIPIFG